MEKQKKSKKKKGTAKKVVLGFLGVVLIVGVTIIGTLAYLSTITDPKTNTFTASKDIVLGLDEPNWNWDDNTNAPKEADKPNPGNFQPKIEYAKDPFLANLTPANGSELAEEWVAMRVDYSITPASGTKTSVTYTNLTTNDKAEGYDANNKAGIIEEITFDTDPSSGKWYQLPAAFIKSITGSDEKYDIFIYKYKLKAVSGKTSMASFTDADKDGSTGTTANTSRLFEKIQIKTQDQLILNGWEDVNNKLSLPTSFEIKVKGAAIKHDSSIAASSIDTAKLGASPSDDDKNTDSYKIAKELVDLLK